MPRKAKRAASMSVTKPGPKRARAAEEPRTSNGSSKKRQHLPNPDPDVAWNGEDDDGFESEEAGSENEGSEDYEDDQSEEIEEDEPEEESSEEDVKTRRRSGGLAKKTVGRRSGPKSRPKSGQVKIMGLGTEIVMKKPRARSPGDTPYEDDTVHPNTMLFLKELAENNTREWLKSHDPDYRASWADWESFLQTMTERIIEVDETIPELPVKDIIFRIYRDVRFSKDPTPYKTNFSAAWSRTGRKGPYAVYYLQIKPNGGSMIAAGLWMPEASALARLRRDIDRRAYRLKSVITSPGIRKEFLAGVAKDERKVVRRFVDEHADTSLKTKPKGFDADHPNIDLLRLRNFTLHKKLEDAEVVRSDAQDRIAELISHLVPFVTYLNSVVMPDESSEGENDGSNNDDDDDDDDDEEEEESE